MIKTNVNKVKRGEYEETQLDSETILAALQRILDSPEFEGTERVRSFLSYVVRETVADRGSRIRGKTILEDVYERSATEGRDPLALIRVDAGRLRRHLSAYYSGSGAGDEIHIQVDPGGYEPKFRHFPKPKAPETERSSRHPSLPFVVVACVVILGFAALWSFERYQERTAAALQQPARQVQPEAVSPSNASIREALFSLSPARLQAANLAAKARSSLFPALEPAWQKQVLGMFRHVVVLDPNYFGGYAGAAQSEAIITLTMPSGEARNQSLASAETAAQRAMDLGASEGWSHSAAATVSFAKRDYEEAFEKSARAVALSPEDINVLIIDALIALFSGDFERANLSAERIRELKQPTDDLPDLSIAASANFHMGDYETARALIMRTVVAGDPISPFGMGYIIAIHERLGEHSEAAKMTELLETAWPGYPVDRWYLTIYRNSVDAQEVLRAMADAGWDRPPRAQGTGNK